MQAHAGAPMFLGVHAPLCTLLSDTKSTVKPYHAHIMPGHAQHKPGPFLVHSVSGGEWETCHLLKT